MAKPECRWSCPEDWSQWSDWLAAGLHARHRWRLPVLMTGKDAVKCGGITNPRLWVVAARAEVEAAQAAALLAIVEARIASRQSPVTAR